MKQTTYRGKTFTRDDVLRAMERFDKEMRASYPDKRWVTYAVEHDEKLYPPKDTLRLVTGMREIGGGGKPVTSRFENLGFRVVTLDERPPANNEMDDAEAVEMAFSLEYDLENSLIANLDQLEQGLKLYRKDGISGQQVDGKAAGRIDILATDSHNDIVVIELKGGEADRQVCGQIQAYMGKGESGWTEKGTRDHCRQ